ncbi:MAG: ABC transporter substrate-binding protein [Methanomicrobiales archaeon]|nr:ABC transporter substrate-binding protein [Methanomicrobiales archaeon]MDI6876049.1 ABC transporter substrate-binding protein [Methanomicrobiales archaeon]
MTVYLGIDDTDIPSSRGTGRLARQIAATLSRDYTILGVTRHQLYVHPSIPYTSHNSSAVLHLGGDLADDSCEGIFQQARELLLAEYIEGSDPGLAVARADALPPEVLAFGRAAKTQVLTQKSALELADACGVLLEGLAGSRDGVIGALAGIGLAASRNDGRFIVRQRTRDLQGTQTVAALLEGGVDRVMTQAGERISEGAVHLKKFPKPALVDGQAVLYVEPWNGGYRDLVVG